MTQPRTKIRSVRWIGRVVLAAACAVADNATASPIYSVVFDDPGGLNAAFYAQIESHTLASGNDWGQYLGGNASLEVVVRFSSSIPRATGRSLTAAFVGSNGPYNVFEQGAAAELRTGNDPNGLQPDIELVFNPTYVSTVLWFDPDPFSRVASVPGTRTDAMSVLLHELGHAFAFNGWRDPFTGLLPGDYESPWDALTVFDGTNFYFLGSTAVSLYGGPVPVTFGNNSHLGNALPRPGSDLIPDLMNGVVFFNGNRYRISPMDLAVFDDTGVELRVAAVPEPATLLLTLSGSIGLMIRRRSTRARHL